MPTYGYRCTSCSYEFEEFQTISEEVLTECPSCKKQSLIRIIGGGAGLHFKGSGFYGTDYKKKPSSQSDSTPSTKTDAKPESKTETKPDTKSDAKPSSKPSDSGSSKSKGDSD